MHPFLSDQLASARLAEIHAEAKRRRAIRNIVPGPGWRFWRRPRPGPRPRLVIDPGARLRPVA